MLRELAVVLSFLPAILARTTFERPPVSPTSGPGPAPGRSAPTPPRKPSRWHRRRGPALDAPASGRPPVASDEAAAGGPTFAIPLIQSQALRWTPMRVGLIALVAAFHALLLALLTVAQVWSLETVPEPPIPVSFFSSVPPPPPPPPAPRKSVATAPARPVVEAPRAVVQPVAIPERAPEPAPADANADFEGVEGGVEGGVPGGVVGGLPGGVVGGVPGGVPGPAPPPAEEILRVGGNVEKPVLLYSVNPRYPELARRARLGGVVIVEAVIDRDGNVVDPRVVKPMPLGLSEAAIEAVRQWRYKPATMNGRPVAVFFTLTVNFRLV